jgi:hypothetical protein
LGLVDPATIGPLQDNGGPTATHALLAGSQAIDHALASLGCVNEFGVQLTTDQRGATRPPGPSSACDVGAFEFGGSFPSPAIFLNGFE